MYNKDMQPLRQIEKAQINFNSVMNLSQDAIMSRLNCHNIGRIIEFDPPTQLCSVELMQIKRFKNQYLTPAILTDVPLIICGSVNAHITMPNPVGATCVLLFMDRDIDNFLSTGQAYVPQTLRKHDFTDCVALTTFKTLVDPIEDYDVDAVTIKHKSEENDTKNEAFIKVYSNELLLQAQTTSPDATETAGIGINEVVNVFNHKYNLGELMGAFLTACENITVDPNTGVLSPASKQAFTDLKSQFEELLG